MSPASAVLGFARYFGIRPPHFTRGVDRPDLLDCEFEDTRDLFFGPDEESKGLKRVREHKARQVCAGCPFAVACGLHGLEHEDYGVWGGLSERDRRVLGGRGIAPGGGRPSQHSVGKVLHHLGIAGFTEGKAKTLLVLWRARKAVLRLEEQKAKRVMYARPSATSWNKRIGQSGEVA